MQSWSLLTDEQRMELAKIGIVTIPDPEDEESITSRVAWSRPTRHKSRAIAKCQVGSSHACVRTERPLGKYGLAMPSSCADCMAGFLRASDTCVAFFLLLPGGDGG